MLHEVQPWLAKQAMQIRGADLMRTVPGRKTWHPNDSEDMLRKAQPWFALQTMQIRGADLMQIVLDLRI